MRSAFAAVLVVMIMTTALSAQTRLEKPTLPTTATRMDTGPAPAGVTVNGSPATASLTWQPVPGAVSYRVVRIKADDPNCCRAESPLLTSTSWIDTGPNGQGLQWSGSYQFTVIATQSNSIYGQTVVTWSRPEPVNPTGLVATQTGEGVVNLKWNSVPGAAYWLFGPGAGGSEGMRVDLPGKLITGVPAGMHEWKVTSKYDPAGFLLAEPTWPRVSLNVEKLSGHYRITLNGAVVNSQTTDNMLNSDGWGDEVRFFGETIVFDRGRTSPTRTGLTRAPDFQRNPGMSVPVYGDVNNFPNRIRAGSASRNGGLAKGDAIPQGVDLSAPYASPSQMQLPLLLWEGDMRNDHEVLLVNASVGEMDDDSRGYGPGSIYDQCPVDQVYEYPAVQEQLRSLEILPPVVEPVREPPTCERSTEYTLPAPNNREIGNLSATNDPSRYFKTGYYLVLTREKIERALAGRSSMAVQVQRADRVSGENGNYTLYVLIERM